MSDETKFERQSAVKRQRTQFEQELVGGFALSDFSLLEGLPYLPSTLEVMERISEQTPEVEIRDEQLECLDAIQTARDQGLEKALVQMATGLGKTTVVAADVKRFLSENPKARVLFLCHQNDILLQARERFESIVGSDATYGNFTGEGQDFHEVTCLFASFQAMRNWRDAFLEDEFDYVVVDESHHSKAATYQPTLQHFKPKFMLGVTATPDRHDLQDIREIFGEEIFRLSLEEALARGLLATVEYEIILDDIDKKAFRHLKNSMKRSKGQIDRTVFIPKKDEEIVRIIKEKASEFDIPKRIIFCKSIEQTEEYAPYFETAAPMHSRLPKWEQDKYIKMFREGAIDTLLTVDMFNEGIDIPDANQVIFLRSTQSKTVFLQQLGRGLRKTPSKESVQVLDFVANCDRLLMLDEMWREVKLKVKERHGVIREALDIIRLDIGSVHFTEFTRDILEILSEIESSREFRNWTAADSINYYLKLKQELGREPLVSDIQHYRLDRKGPPESTVLRYYDGKINNLRRAMGIEVKIPHLMTAEELIEEMVKIIDREGRTPKTTEIRKLGGPASTQYLRVFGSYKEYVKAANRRWLERRKRSAQED